MWFLKNQKPYSLYKPLRFSCLYNLNLKVKLKIDEPDLDLVFNNFIKVLNEYIWLNINLWKNYFYF
jgi:hypothetical protein